MRNFLIRICHKGTGILIKLWAQILKAVCVGCDQRKLFRVSAVCSVGDKTGAIRAPEHLRMLLIALTLYGNLTVNINIAAIFQILLSVKSQLRMFPGFFLSQDQIVLHVGKRICTVRRYRCLCLNAAFLPCLLRFCLFQKPYGTINPVSFYRNRPDASFDPLLPFIKKRSTIRIPANFRISVQHGIAGMLCLKLFCRFIPFSHILYTHVVSPSYKNTLTPGPSGRFSRTQTTIWTIHTRRKAMEYGSIIEIRLPIPKFLSYFFAIPIAIGIYG